MSIEAAKMALDRIINKGRVHLYKPIQIAEILNRHRLRGNINLNKLEEYRNPSKRWRNEISMLLVGRISTSSARYQDDVFNENAMPPRYLDELGRENLKQNGVVEAYIYSNLEAKHKQLADAMAYVKNSGPEAFDLRVFMSSFREQQGLKRSIDKVYEAVVYALFDTIVNAMNATVNLSVDETKLNLVYEFEDFTRIVLGIDRNTLSYSTSAALYRVGVTNASDRGLDMWSNFGPAIQVKHLTLDVDAVDEIAGGIKADRVVIVCKDCEKELLTSVLMQIGWANKLQGIIVETDLIDWYGKALKGKYSVELGKLLLETLLAELENEFPSSKTFVDFYTRRGYDEIELRGTWSLD